MRISKDKLDEVRDFFVNEMDSEGHLVPSQAAVAFFLGMQKVERIEDYDMQQLNLFLCSSFVTESIFSVYRKQAETGKITLPQAFRGLMKEGEKMARRLKDDDEVAQ